MIALRFTLVFNAERISGSSSVGRASPFQGEGRGFESRLPLHLSAIQTWLRQDLDYAISPLSKLGFAKIWITLYLRYPNLASPRSGLRYISAIQTWLRQDLDYAAH